MSGLGGRRVGVWALLLALAVCAAGLSAAGEVKPLEPLPEPKPAQPEPVAPPRAWQVPTEEETPAWAAPPAEPGEWRLRVPEEEQPRAERPGTGAEASPKDPPVVSALLAEALAKEEKARRENSPLKPQETVALYRAVVVAEPNNAEARYRLGLALARAGDPKSAASELERAVVLAPEDPRILTDYATVATQIGSLEKALDACLRAHQAAPNSARACNALGNVYLAGGNHEKAVEAYSLAVQHEPRNARYIHNLGRAHLSGANPKMAVDVLTEVLSLEPTCAEALNDRATAFRELKDIERALHDLHNAVSFRPDFALAHYNLALIYANDQDIVHCQRFKALEHAQSAVKLTEAKDPQFLMGLAEAYRANHQYEKSIETARQAITLDPRKDYQEQLSRYQQLLQKGFVGKTP